MFTRTNNDLLKQGILYMTSDVSEIVFHKIHLVSDDMKELVTDLKPKILVLDISIVERVDSSGMGMLLSVLAHCKRNNCEMKVFGTSPKIIRVLSLSGICNLFTLIDSIEEVKI